MASGALHISQMRFGIREGKPADAAAIARAHVTSWTDSYRGILPEGALGHLDVDSRRRLLADRDRLVVVAHDLTHGDIVGLCDAGPIRERRGPRAAGEIYALYLVPHAKRYGLGTEMFDHARSWLAARGMTELVIWVLANNHPARRFYEAMGGELEARIPSSFRGFPIVEVAYYWGAR
jgi:GNAT superfamily N-acetyltransferase